MNQTEESPRSLIPFEYSKEFADTWADINALYHVLGQIEDNIWSLVKWMRHSLPVREYEIMRLRYAPFDNGGRQTLEAVATKLGMTKQRVKQLEDKALATLGVSLYKTEIVYARGGTPNTAGKRAALSSNKFLQQG